MTTNSKNQFTVNEFGVCPIGWLWGWHFLPGDGCLNRVYPKARVVAGEGYFKTKAVVCKTGLHGSHRALDALQNAPGPIVARVVLSGTLDSLPSKSCATELTVHALADATCTLREFACWCAEQVAINAGEHELVVLNTIEIARRFARHEATREEVSAAKYAAMSAANAAMCAAKYAAMSAAYAAMCAAYAAMCAARSAMSAANAAMYAARSAKYAAALDMATPAQNAKLEEMLFDLIGYTRQDEIDSWSFLYKDM